MAARFAVGGSFTWSATNTTNWSATSGGAGGASVPTSADTATFDLMSNGVGGNYTVMMGTGAVCSDLTIGAPTLGNVTFSGTGVFDIHGSLSIAAGTIMSGATGTMTFRATSGTRTIATNSVQLASSIVLNGSGGTFQLTTPLVTSGTNWTRTAGVFAANGQAVTFNGETLLIGGAGCTFAAVTRTGTATKNNTMLFGIGTTFTTLTPTGHSKINRLLVASSTIGAPITITVTTLVANAVDFRDITKAGAASGDLSALTNHSGDCGGNTGWTFTTAAAQTWSGVNGDNWSTNAWTSRVPLPQDNVTINAAFSAGRTVTLDMPRAGKSITWANTGNQVTWAKPSAFTMYGSLTLSAPAVLANTGTAILTFEGRSAATITCNGNTLTNTLYQWTVGTSITLSDSFSSSAGWIGVAGEFIGNNLNHTALSWLWNNFATITVTAGTGTLTATGTGTAFLFGALSTVSAASATFKITNVSASASKQFSGGGKTFKRLEITGDGGLYSCGIIGNNTFESLAVTGGLRQTVRFDASGTTTLTGGAGAFFSGVSEGVVSVTSTSPGTRYIITSAIAIVSRCLAITDCDAAGSVPAIAIASRDAGNNLDWAFYAADIERNIDSPIHFAPLMSL